MIILNYPLPNLEGWSLGFKIFFQFCCYAELERIKYQDFFSFKNRVAASPYLLDFFFEKRTLMYREAEQRNFKTSPAATMELKL